MHRPPLVKLFKLLILLGLSLTFRLIHTQIKHKKRTQQFLAEFIFAESEGFEPFYTTEKILSYLCHLIPNLGIKNEHIFVQCKDKTFF